MRLWERKWEEVFMETNEVWWQWRMAKRIEVGHDSRRNRAAVCILPWRNWVGCRSMPHFQIGFERVCEPCLACHKRWSRSHVVIVNDRHDMARTTTKKAKAIHESATVGNCVDGSAVFTRQKWLAIKMDNITPLAIRHHLMSNQLIIALNNVQLDSVL